ncbi:MAG TPA: heavy-metal-associated domain-containing protein [Bacillota bacterium]|nr:heavy-metal-associated domain-containing protein [Bacillota bacterium]
METTLQISGMTCKNCVASVQGALEQLSGVSNVNVDLDSGKVVVNHDEGAVSLESLKDSVLDQGFDVE